jgi:uncharacterized protein with ParB-like and HNH nuclease domain
MKNQQPKLLNLKELFTGNYIIPIYQRDYAWTEKEIKQMLDDIFSVMKSKDNYYIGTLIVYPRNNGNQVVYETIDGQQRVTTLMILMTYLLNNKELSEILKNQSYLINSSDLIQHLEFDSRERSTKSLKALAENEFNDATDNITEAYGIIDKYLSKKSAEGKTLFISYLINLVKILRVEVPEDTDLNHYFEIMNSRGEQLEKHEILKSRLLSLIKEQKSAYQLLANIWEACSNMERYVQYGFHSDIRQQIFGTDWNQLLPRSFDDIVQKISDKSNFVQDESLEDEKATISIASILENSSKYIKEDEKGKVSEKPDRFNPVINFSNFLLIVLKIMTKDSTIGLDDKFLLSENTFKKHLNHQNPEKVKEFGFLLLKTKFLFDKFVIKREYFENKDQWSLKKLYWYNPKSQSYINTVSISDKDENRALNKQLIMIQSMFHVSNPSQTYKNWLLALLEYLNTVEIQEDFQTGQNLFQYLEKLAKNFMVYRYLSSIKMEFDEIIAKSMLDLTLDVSHIDTGNLNKGTQVENFIFNYLDFVLWKDESLYTATLIENGNDRSIFEKIKNFEFIFRSSVEHYYPQTPFENHEKLDVEVLNNFGNLCLLSSSLNSRLNNFSPEAKKDHFKASNIAESIKQSIMMSYPSWTEKSINKHGEDMTNLIKSSLGIKIT